MFYFPPRQAPANRQRKPRGYSFAAAYAKRLGNRPALVRAMLNRTSAAMARGLAVARPAM